MDPQGALDPHGALLALTADDLGADAHAARRARTRISEFLLPRDTPPRVDRRVLDDVLLVVSELVTNVIVHTHGAPALSVRVEPDRTVRVEIDDRDDSIPVVTREPGERSQHDRATGDRMAGDRVAGHGLGGHGLWIVSSIASRWGVEPHRSGGKTVWAVFAAMSASGAGRWPSYS